jgi:hypothetical protein
MKTGREFTGKLLGFDDYVSKSCWQPKDLEGDRKPHLFMFEKREKV